MVNSIEFGVAVICLRKPQISAAEQKFFGISSTVWNPICGVRSIELVGLQRLLCYAGKDGISWTATRTSTLNCLFAFK